MARGAEHVQAHCVGERSGHEVVVLTCAHCLDEVVQANEDLKGHVISLSGDVKEALQRGLDIAQAKGMMMGPISFMVQCAKCHTPLDARIEDQVEGVVISVNKHQCPRKKASA